MCEAVLCLVVLVSIGKQAEQDIVSKPGSSTLLWPLHCFFFFYAAVVAVVVVFFQVPALFDLVPILTFFSDEQ